MTSEDGQRGCEGGLSGRGASDPAPSLRNPGNARPAHRSFIQGIFID